MGSIKISRRPIRVSSQTQGSSVVVLLPAVGPFSDLTPVSVSSLSSYSISNQADTSSSRFRSNPNTYNSFTLTNASYFANSSTDAAVFLWANVVSISSGSEISVSGGSGGTGDVGSGGGSGGSGGSGGGGGAGADLVSSLSGGVAGAGISGGVGQDGNVRSGGVGGAGNGEANYGTDVFSYGTGGGSNSSGGNGYGGAGDGLSSNGGDLNPGGGGGAGGGLIVIICNSLTGTGAFNSNGGDGGSDSVFGSIANGGGGGVIYVATKAYTGGITPSILGGSGGSVGEAKIFKINANLSLTQKLWSDVW